MVAGAEKGVERVEERLAEKAAGMGMEMDLRSLRRTLPTCCTQMVNHGTSMRIRCTRSVVLVEMAVEKAAHTGSAPGLDTPTFHGLQCSSLAGLPSMLRAPVCNPNCK